jgi:outer membrane protein OmpA-like peptidoglycan-associated protein
VFSSLSIAFQRVPINGTRLAYPPLGAGRDPAISEEEPMQKLSLVLLITATLAASGCATRTFVRKSVSASADTLNARIDTNQGEIKEVRDKVDQVDTRLTGAVTTVDGKVAALDTKTTQGMTALKGELKTDVQNADQHASTAQSAADKAATGVSALDQRFQNRNNFNVSDEKAVQFKFGSAKLDKEQLDTLDNIANMLMQNSNAIIVLEGRTDSVGPKDYNQQLGERRVDAVKHYLVVEKGVPVYKIHEVSFGSEKPVAENKTREGREKNRAVVMTVMVPKSEGSVASRNN